MDTAPPRPIGSTVHQFETAYDDVGRYDRFITTIEQRSGSSWEAPERAAHATLRTLGARLTWGDARHLAADLPRERRMWLLRDADGDAQPFDADEFVRVAERARDPSAPEPMTAAEFHGRVAERAGLDPPGPEAVLEALAEGIAGGQPDDTSDVPPAELRPPFRRRRERTGGKAQRMSLDEVVERTAERERVPCDDALEHARAVNITLGGALPKELSDLLAQRPRRYQEAPLELHEPTR